MDNVPPILLDQLVHKYPWLLALLSFIGTARVIAKPGSLWIKSLITWAYERTITTSSTIDDHWIERMVEMPAYIWFAWLIDFLCSVKLPLAGDLFKPTTPPAA